MKAVDNHTSLPRPFVSIFIPAYNEEENIETAVERCTSFLKTLGKPYEVIVIDDGSTDATAAIADRLAEESRCVRVVHHPFNIGYGGAQKSGFRYARGEYVALMPGDNQFDPACLKEYLALAPQYDIVVGYRKKRQDARSRKIFSRSFNFAMRRIFDLHLRDINCVKLISRRVIDAIDIESRGAFVDAEIMIRAQRSGFSYTEIEVPHFPRLRGEEKGAHPLVVMITFFELLRLWRRLCIGSSRHTTGTRSP